MSESRDRALCSRYGEALRVIITQEPALAEIQRQLLDAKLNVMGLVKQYYEDKRNTSRAAEAQDLIDGLQSCRALVDKLAPAGEGR